MIFSRIFSKTLIPTQVLKTVSPIGWGCHVLSVSLTPSPGPARSTHWAGRRPLLSPQPLPAACPCLPMPPATVMTEELSDVKAVVPHTQGRDGSVRRGIPTCFTLSY